MARCFLNKLEKLNLKPKQIAKITDWYLDDVTELRWALRVALDRYRLDDLDRAEKVLAKYEEL